MRHNSGGGDSMADMLGQGNRAAAHFPGAAISRGELELVGIVALGEATGYGPYVRLGFRSFLRILRESQQGGKTSCQQAKQQTFDRHSLSSNYHAFNPPLCVR